MSEDSREIKSKKLSAARKKLKEYRLRNTAANSSTITHMGIMNDSIPSSGHVSSNISERSDSELQLNSGNLTPNCLESDVPISNIIDRESCKSSTDIIFPDHSQNNAIQILINEKTQLMNDINKYQSMCNEKELDLEKLQREYSKMSSMLQELQQIQHDQQQQYNQVRTQNDELHKRLAQRTSENEENTSHLSELQQQLVQKDAQLNELKKELLEKHNSLELAELRIRQLSDDDNISVKDSRIEALIQTQYMYEQQIRDLQAMVQQLTDDKDQSKTQYLAYVSQLNKEINQLKDQNDELQMDNTRLQDHDKQLQNHVQNLEKDIQKNIIKQEHLNEESKAENLHEELCTLRTRLSETENNRNTLQMKIQSQNNELDNLRISVHKLQLEKDNFKEKLEMFVSEQHNNKQLLFTMESDKVAASRALSQNKELKEKLEELESRFIQLTNEKAHLVNLYKTEQYTCHERFLKCEILENQSVAFSERLKLKDEEMIRLSHENEAFRNENITLQKQIESLKQEFENCKRNSDSRKDIKTLQNEDNYSKNHDDCTMNSPSMSTAEDIIEHRECEINKIKSYNNSDQKNTHDNDIDEHDHCNIEDRNEYTLKIKRNDEVTTSYAVEKLQERFTQLIHQVADLTDEKQRLEHLVLQLQGETETIGEYITLYQNQRRMLKQREYEKANQTQLLQAERQKIQDRLTLLNNLISKLSINTKSVQPAESENSNSIINTIEPEVNINAMPCTTIQTNPVLNETTGQINSLDLNGPESHQTLNEIQDIIMEIQENTKDKSIENHSVDHLQCCLGKFEVV